MPLDRPAGFGSAQTKDVNDRGAVLLIPHHIWQSGRFTPFNPPDAQHVNQLPSKLNNRGIVAGNAYELRDAVLSSIVATLWLDGQGHDLNWLISGQDPLRPSVRAAGALLINDRNQVVVEAFSGVQTSYYLLTAVR
jgi:hypothetical protein